MTARQLEAKLAALPEEQKDLEVYSYNDLDESYTAIGNPAPREYAAARYVKADTPWYPEEPSGSFIEI